MHIKNTKRLTLKQTDIIIIISIISIIIISIIIIIVFNVNVNVNMRFIVPPLLKEHGCIA